MVFEGVAWRWTRKECQRHSRSFMSLNPYLRVQRRYKRKLIIQGICRKVFVSSQLRSRQRILGMRSPDTSHAARSARLRRALDLQGGVPRANEWASGETTNDGTGVIANGTTAKKFTRNERLRMRCVGRKAERKWSQQWRRKAGGTQCSSKSLRSPCVEVLPLPIVWLASPPGRPSTTGPGVPRCQYSESTGTSQACAFSAGVPVQSLARQLSMSRWL